MYINDIKRKFMYIYNDKIFGKLYSSSMISNDERTIRQFYIDGFNFIECHKVFFNASNMLSGTNVTDARDLTFCLCLWCNKISIVPLNLIDVDDSKSCKRFCICSVVKGLLSCFSSRLKLYCKDSFFTLRLQVLSWLVGIFSIFGLYCGGYPCLK